MPQRHHCDWVNKAVVFYIVGKFGNIADLFSDAFHYSDSLYIDPQTSSPITGLPAVMRQSLAMAAARATLNVYAGTRVFISEPA